MKTDKTTFVNGEEVELHQCDNCEETIDGIPFLYWESRDFTLCYVCVAQLYREIMG